LRGAILIDGTGGPAQGPVDIVIVNDRISEIVTIGAPGRIEEDKRPPKGGREIDMTGFYVMPGFINSHVHLLSLNDPQKTPTDYILKLWLINGITSVRELGSDRPPEWLLDIKQRSASNQIVAPRIDVYPYFSWGQKTMTTVVEARRRVDDLKKMASTV
jgi:dihydroorotase-like cyclic amidohydrolase